MKRILALLAACALGAVANAAALTPYAVTTKDVKPGATVTPMARAVFDCGGHETVDLAVFQADSLVGDTTDGPTDLDRYGCVPWAEAGPERIYQLEVTQDLELWAGLVDRDPNIDLDLFLLDGCDTDSCMVGANSEFTAILSAGTYYLVVDGFGDAGTPNFGPFTVSLETRPLGLPDQACTTALPEACTVGGTIPLADNLFDKPNLMQAYSCNSSQTRAGDAWYALDLLPGQAVTARATAVADSLDLVLWLFADCGPAPTCLAAADDSLSGHLENLTWQSDVPAPVTVYLGVDAVRAPADSNGGSFALDIDCGTEVPVDGDSFGSLKALFR